MKKNRVYAIIITLMLLFNMVNVVNPTMCSAASIYSWSFVDGNGSDGLNGDVAQNATKVTTATFNNELYAAWSEINGKDANGRDTSVIRVKKYDGSSWSFVDGGTISVDTTKQSDAPKLVEYKGNLYAIWQETYGLTPQSSYWSIRVKKYDGKSWVSVDGDTGISTSKINGRNPYAIVYNNELYAMWDESNGSGKAQIRKYDGSSWTDVKGIDKTKGLNYYPDKDAQKPIAAIYNSKLYITWQESNGSNPQIRVKSFDGTAWNSEDGNGVNGINKDTTKWAFSPQIINYNNELYAIWQEDQIRVKKYNGTTWTLNDGNEATGLASGYVPRAVVCNNQLYVIYHANNKIRVQTYDGTTWSFADEGTTGLNKNTNQSASYGTLAVLNDKLYAAWYENNSSNKSQIRVAAMTVTESPATAPTSIVLAKGSTNPVGQVVNVAIPAAGGTNTSGKITGWVGGLQDRIKFTVTDGAAAHSSITINGADYTSGADYTIASGVSTLTILVTTTETGKTAQTRTFTVPVAPATEVTVDSGSAAGAVAGDSSITGLTSSKTYNVEIVSGSNNGKYVNKNGTVSSLPVAITGVDSITGLVNGITYRVTDVTPVPAAGLTVTAAAEPTPVSGKVILTITPGTSDVNHTVYYRIVDSDPIPLNIGDLIILEGWKAIANTNAHEITVPNGKYIEAVEVATVDNRVLKWGKSAATNDRYVPPAPTYSIDLSQKDTLNFDSKTVGYGVADLSTITISKTGTGDITNLSVCLDDTGKNYFTVGTLGSIVLNGTVTSTTFTISPKAGLTAGTYTGKVTVTGRNGVSKSFNVSFTVNAAQTPTPTPTPDSILPITGSVVDGGSGSKVSEISAIITVDSNGNETVAMNAAQAVTMIQPDGKESVIADISKITIASADGSSIPVSADGQIQVKGLTKGTDNKYKITYDLGNGNKITIGTMEIKVANDGKVSLISSLIDPYGIITDAATGQAIQGVDVTLYYADTQRNRANGKSPNTVVSLPGIDGFKPNNNKNPQVSDVNGAYGFMVFPNADYYVVAVKYGYDKYVSGTISVNEEIVRHDIKMSKAKAASEVTSQNKNSSYTDKKLVQTGSTLDNSALVSIGILFIVLGTIIGFRKK